MKPQIVAAAGIIFAVYLFAAILLHPEEAKKRADFTLCPLCGEEGAK